MNPHYSKQSFRFKKKELPSFPVFEYVKGIMSGDRSALAKAITLVESNHPNHYQWSQKLLKEVLPQTGRSVRIGITGIPGAGKSTFIEKFGMELCKRGKKVAVLAIDPTSPISKGSILGDKTRMELLSREPNAFIRPSPTDGTLGGVHRKTREALLLCEAAGYDVILVETVGVGQSEIAVRTMVDMFIMLTITGSGDELQGIKKGMIELSDCIIITKADGDNRQKAIKAKNDYNKVLRYLKQATNGWQTRAYTVSAYTGEGIREIWDVIENFVQVTKQRGIFYERRKKQTKDWLSASISEQLLHLFYQNEEIKKLLPALEADVMEGDLPVSSAVDQLMKKYYESILKDSWK